MRLKLTETESITGREMRALETNAEYFGVSRLLLMENAGHQVASEIHSMFKPGKLVVVFCGLGGNGGDGLVVARHLHSLGFKTTVVLAGRAKDIVDKATLENWRSLQFLREAISFHEVIDSTMIPEIDGDVIVDALLGTGASGKLRPPIPQLIKRINNAHGFRVAVDLPTGVNVDTGEVADDAIKADLTITLHKTKKGLEKAKKYVGKLVVKSIGLPKEFQVFAGPGDVLLVTKSRPPKSHKGDFGRLLVIGGNETFFGAPALVALAAMRTGIDLAFVAAPEKAAHAISSMSPDLITVKLEGNHLNSKNLNALEGYVEKSEAVVIGPGLGLHQETVAAVHALIELIESAKRPLLLDADGLKAFAQAKRKLKVPLLLTPHTGEYAVLTGKKVPEDLSMKINHVSKTAEELGATILLKGAIDVVSDGKRFKLNFSGNPGMTVGGTGDVLSGIVGALLAQKTDSFEAAVAGAFVNGAAGDFIFKDKGYHMVASDLINMIPKVFDDPMSHLQVRRTSERPS